MTNKESFNKEQEDIDRHIRELKKIRASLISAKSTDNKIDRLKDAYSYVKDISSEIYTESDPEDVYAIFYGITHCLNSMEEDIPKRFLYDIPPYTFPETTLTRNKQNALDYLVIKTRLYLKKRLKGIPLEHADLQNQCSQASFYIWIMCLLRGIPCKRYKIEPGYIRSSELYHGGGWHCFNIITLNGKNYLIDCTYSQFFLETRCLKDRIGIVTYPGAYAGSFMDTIPREKVARTLLSKGWIELEGDTLKHYLDGFTISNRNGLYYENINAILYTTDYTTEDYWRFLKHKDSQVNHEEREELGYQYRPLKNPKMKF